LPPTNSGAKDRINVIFFLRSDVRRRAAVCNHVSGFGLAGLLCRQPEDITTKAGLMLFKELAIGKTFTVWKAGTSSRIHAVKVDDRTAFDLAAGESFTVHKSKGVDQAEGFDETFQPARYLGEMVLAKPSTSERVYIMRATITHTESVSAQLVEFPKHEARSVEPSLCGENLAAVLALVGNEIARLQHFYEILALMVTTSDNHNPTNFATRTTPRTLGTLTNQAQVTGWLENHFR
jgi:hypothetical protein